MTLKERIKELDTMREKMETKGDLESLCRFLGAFTKMFCRLIGGYVAFMGRENSLDEFLVMLRTALESEVKQAEKFAEEWLKRQERR
ncbi:MAG: hypothetical protein QXQ53_01325 [Candidatus Methanosuratincola sp.]